MYQMVHLAFIVSKQNEGVCCQCPSKHETLFLLVVTKITVFAASALLLIPALSASALTLGSRVVARQDAGSIASLTELDVVSSQLVSSLLDVGQSLVVVKGCLVPKRLVSELFQDDQLPVLRKPPPQCHPWARWTSQRSLRLV